MSFLGLDRAAVFVLGKSGDEGKGTKKEEKRLWAHVTRTE